MNIFFTPDILVDPSERRGLTFAVFSLNMNFTADHANARAARWVGYFV